MNSSYPSVCISSGHGLFVRGASGIIDEVDEARKLVEQLADDLRDRGVAVKTYHDDVSHSQSENLNRITDWHNAQGAHELDISCHFNAYEQVSKPMGTEVLYVTQGTLAAGLSEAISDAAGFINRGAKKRTDLHFLNATEAPSVLLEICFVDSETDCELYEKFFFNISSAIADYLYDADAVSSPPEAVAEEEALFTVTGRASWFGGPDDTGVSPSEGLAFHYEITEDNQHLFLPNQPSGTTGLARRLNPEVHYLACRWDYDVTPKSMLQKKANVALVRGVENGIEMIAYPADWGPHETKTDNDADLSPGLLRDLHLEDDDTVEVIYPYKPEDG
jgi:N-acetylmuramoyl-L-alanine amidase